MKVQKIDLKCFRLFQEKTLHFEPGINFILGENGVGKTTWLEALYLLMAGRSFRTSQMQDLKLTDSPFFRIETHFEKWGVPQYLKMVVNDSERKIQHNATDLTSLSGLVGILQGVLLAPHDIELIKGSPASRRHYLDFQIAQVDPLYVHHLFRISKGIKQRNMQLRTKKMQAIESFEETIAQSAAYIIQQREAQATTLDQLLKEIYCQISGKQEPVTLKYHSSLGKGLYEEIIKKLRNQRPKDIDLGYTSFGTHRDDLYFSIATRPVRHFASEGEIRSFAWALKLAEWELLRKRSQENPLLLVDDIGSSFDSKRLHNLFTIFSQLDQVIITSASDLNLSRSTFNTILIKSK